MAKEQNKKASVFQTYNNRLDAWVKMKRKKNGQVRIVEVKKERPTSKYRGVSVK